MLLIVMKNLIIIVMNSVLNEKNYIQYNYMIKVLILILLFIIMYMMCNKKKIIKCRKMIKKEKFINNKKVDFNLDKKKIIYYDKEKPVDTIRNNIINNINLFMPKNSNDELNNVIDINKTEYINKNIDDIYKDIKNNKFYNISKNLNDLNDNIDIKQYKLNNKYNSFDTYSINEI